VRLRLHATPAECEHAAHRLAEVFDVVAISGPYPDRGPSRLVRAYLELRLHPTPGQPVSPAGPGQPGRGLR
jgi:hypothetical protein